MLISKRADVHRLKRHADVLVGCAPTPSLLISSQRQLDHFLDPQSQVDLDDTRFMCHVSPTTLRYTL